MFYTAFNLRGATDINTSYHSFLIYFENSIKNKEEEIEETDIVNTPANIALLNNIDLMWGCNDESIISISAALNTALSFSNTKYLDLDGSLDLAKDLVSGGFNLKNGVMKPLNKPGLGVELI